MLWEKKKRLSFCLLRAMRESELKPGKKKGDVALQAVSCPAYCHPLRAFRKLFILNKMWNATSEQSWRSAAKQLWTAFFHFKKTCRIALIHDCTTNEVMRRFRRAVVPDAAWFHRAVTRSCVLHGPRTAEPIQKTKCGRCCFTHAYDWNLFSMWRRGVAARLKQEKSRTNWDKH